jgi:hypothetical protein
MAGVGGYCAGVTNRAGVDAGGAFKTLAMQGLLAKCDAM